MLFESDMIFIASPSSQAYFPASKNFYPGYKANNNVQFTYL